MTTQHMETLIVGAGQAGLSTGYHLQRMSRPILIVDANERIGDNWRRHYDSLRLYTPAKYSGLPGMAFLAEDRWSYPVRDDVAEFLERYALQWDLPVRMSTRVDRLVARPGGGYAAFIGDDTVTCDNVVVATGTFGRTPNVPDFATGWTRTSCNCIPASIDAPTNYSRGRCWWWVLRIPARISPTRRC